MKKSLVILTPAANLQAANLLGTAFGLGEQNFTVPLGPAESDSTEPEITHYGMLHQASLPDFRETLYQAQEGNLPPVEWAEYGVTEEQVQAVIDALIMDVAEETYAHPSQHFNAVLAENSLVQVDA
ncbi:hypothetical protein [Marinobacter adhaerens]|uniref:hypothetical protein n=1 Tax=Marinobacter adhaerens TaxID=1033846 RepID=UPI003D2ACBD3